MYEQNTVYFVGEAKSPENNPITKQYTTFFAGFVVERESGEIIDVDCTAILDSTKQFIQALFIGKSFCDPDGVIKAIEERYFGSSQKALIVAFKNAQKKYDDTL